VKCARHREDLPLPLLPPIALPLTSINSTFPDSYSTKSLDDPATLLCPVTPFPSAPLQNYTGWSTMAHIPFRAASGPSRQHSRQMSIDPHNELNPHMDHYIGIDVGTGSARACVIDAKGDIIGLASENIGLWQPEQGYYVSLRAFDKGSRS